VIDLKELQEALGILPQPKMVMKAPSVSAWGRAIEIPPEGLSLKQGECKLIEEILRLTKGNKTRASQILGISRPRLGRKLEEYKIDWTRSVAEAH
jgi:DNA-binding NtrC family response regulator